MNWKTLFSTRRTGDAPHKAPNPDAARTSFQRDYDRLIFSSAFRRLQNKTQVFPLPGPSVFVHNRLTHSLEVASVGRSLGKHVGDAIAAAHPDADDIFRDFYRYELSSVIAAACLAHDIGNPPFGHSGEDAIRAFFREELHGATAKSFLEQLTPEQQKDFTFFEGNANALRILTDNFGEAQSGYNLTVTTLAAIVKYPSASHEGFNKSTGLIATKKSGYFQSELGLYRNIAKQLGIPEIDGFNTAFSRHPFVFLTEAADDICYRVMDMEDAHRLRIISLQQFEALFLPFFSDTEGFNSSAYVAGKLAAMNDDNQKVQYLRARWIGLMVDACVQAFMHHEHDLLAGTLQKPLLDCLPASMQQQLDAISAYSVKHIYNHRTVLEIEVAGFHVIGGLLKHFTDAVLHPTHPRSRNLLQMIPPQFAITAGKDLYADLLSVTDFISGMTDLYATDLYRRITGISIAALTAM